MQFYSFYPQPNLHVAPLWLGGHEFYNFLSPYPTEATYQKLVKIGPVVLKKMLTHDRWQRMPTYRNRSPEWIRCICLIPENTFQLYLK